MQKQEPETLHIPKTAIAETAILSGVVATVVAVIVVLVFFVFDLDGSDNPAPELFEPLVITACDPVTFDDNTCDEIYPELVLPGDEINVIGTLCNITDDPVTMRFLVEWVRRDGLLSAPGLDSQVTSEPGCKIYDASWVMPPEVTVDAETNVASCAGPRCQNVSRQRAR